MTVLLLLLSLSDTQSDVRRARVKSDLITDDS